MKLEIKIGLKQTKISRGANLPNGNVEGLFGALQFGHVSDQRGALVKPVDEFRRFLGVDWEAERAAFKLGDVFLNPFKLDFKIGASWYENTAYQGSARYGK